MNGELDYDEFGETDWHYKQMESDFSRMMGGDMVAIPEKAHETERKNPNQAARFKEIIEEMYQVHLDKNADYSPANVLGVGEIGLVVRLWDKMTRLMNLLGFEIDVKFVEYRGPKEARNESITDTYMDMAVYAIIARLYREGKWGN